MVTMQRPGIVRGPNTDNLHGTWSRPLPPPDMLIASDWYLQGKIRAEDFEQIARRLVSAYGATMLSLARDNRPHGLTATFAALKRTLRSTARRVRVLHD